MTDLTGLPPVSAPLPWQAQDWALLNRQLAAGQLPHALMVTGAQYTGKSQLALALARLLLCHEPKEGLNCGVCHACELSAAGSHGDFRWLEPEEKSRVIKIDQVRQVVEFTTKTASFGQRKVVVLVPADSMNVNAANGLLKSLEEPAADTYLVLVCHRLQGVPATIRSRCRMLKLHSPDEGQCITWLDQVTGAREHSEKLLALADDRPMLAAQLYREDSADSLANIRLGLRGLISGRITPAQVGALLSDIGVEELLVQLSTELQSIVRALPREQLVCRQGQGAFILMDEIARLQRAVGAGANPNRQMLLESLLAKCQRELGETGLGDNIQTQGELHT
jgi:DNA polymerase-3 subunit delta'